MAHEASTTPVPPARERRGALVALGLFLVGTVAYIGISVVHLADAVFGLERRLAIVPTAPCQDAVRAVLAASPPFREADVRACGPTEPDARAAAAASRFARLRRLHPEDRAEALADSRAQLQRFLSPPQGP